MFKTTDGQARYFAAYDATLALWPVPVESFDAPTRFGRTHVHARGPRAAPPLVLLPGQAVSSTMWYPNIEALSQAYRVYAPDILGDMGKSVSTCRFTKPTEFADWLNDLFDELRLEKAHMAGLSYGGFIALRLAIAAPERLRRLVLMSPASLLPLRPVFFVRMAAMLLPGSVLSLNSKQAILLGAYSANTAPAIKQMMTTTDFRFNTYLPPTCTDEDLRQIRAPTLLLLGDHDVVIDTKAVLKRAVDLIPHIEAVLIPGAGHAMNFDQPEIVHRRILDFLREEVGRPAPSAR